MKKLSITASVTLLMVILLSACSGVNTNLPLSNPSSAQAQVQTAPTDVPQATQPTLAAQPPIAVNGSALTAVQGTLEQIYQTVSPSVVSIQVEVPAQGQSFNFPFGGGNNNQQAPLQQALGSGFVWDKSGNIVTNDHVVDGATSIKVQFSDGTVADAKLVGADPDSDLAVIKVSIAADKLFPVTLTDSAQVKVGQLAIAIGNPFGLEHTMTVGIISALGRELPSNAPTGSNGLSYSIPDVIQTDAPINPGNSGGVLLNDQGQVVGVTAAIESSTNSNAGIGFVIPSNIVKRVVPALIVDGKYQHAYIGITGATLTSDIAQQVNLPAETRGALVIDVAAGSPADKGGLKAGSKTITLNGTDVQIGGDVITAVNGDAINSMDDLVSYLASKTDVGQKVTLTILRNGNQQTVDVTLAARPTTATPSSSNTSGSATGASLGITAATLNSQINAKIGLPADTTGVLVISVLSGSAADQAGLVGGNQSVTVNGQQLEIGGDVIVALDNHPIDSVTTLRDFLSSINAGDTIVLTIIRNGQTMDLQVTLGSVQ